MLSLVVSKWLLLNIIVLYEKNQKTKLRTYHTDLSARHHITRPTSVPFSSCQTCLYPGNPDLTPKWICIIVGNRIRIRIRMKSWIPIRNCGWKCRHGRPWTHNRSNEAQKWSHGGSVDHGLQILITLMRSRIRIRNKVRRGIRIFIKGWWSATIVLSAGCYLCGAGGFFCSLKGLHGSPRTIIVDVDEI